MSFSAAEAERYLNSRESLGMRFGLERIRKLVSVLGMPQHRFASIHVVGTNGKSSVTEITAMLLEAHGVSAGAYLSPHSERWSERVRIGGAEIGADRFAEAVERVAHAVEAVERTLGDGEAVTQFEAGTAAAFVALAAAGVEAGVIEAGLGGRLDATNVLPSQATVLTSIGLEHTQWLGDTEAEIAAEKLDVLRDHSTLVFGPLSPEVEALARETAAARQSRVISVRDLAGAVRLPSEAPYLRRNFAVALAAAEVIVGRLDPQRVLEVASGLELPGRAELRDGDPPFVLDAAHNPAGAAALAEALPRLCGERPVIAVIAVLSDKDAAGIVDALAGRVEAFVATEVPAEVLRGSGRPGASALAAGELAGIARATGRRASADPDPRRAVETARAAALRSEGAVLLTGSHYLLAFAERSEAAGGGGAR